MAKKSMVAAIALLSFFASGVKSQQPILVTDLLNIRNLGNIALSPDGNKVAFTVTSIVQDEKNVGDYLYRTQIWLANTSGNTQPFQFTTAKEGASQPVWSPDGNQIAFVRAVEGIAQIFIASMHGGEPQQITNGKIGASNPVWSPNGAHLLFTASFSIQHYVNDSLLNPAAALLPLFDMEKPGLGNEYLKNSTFKANPNGSLQEIRAYLRQNETDKKAKVIHQLDFQQESTTSADMNIQHVFMINAQGLGTAKAITKGFGSYSNPQFVGNTAQIVLEGTAFPTFHLNRRPEKAIFLTDTAGKNLQPLMIDSGISYSSATLSPAGNWLAYQAAATMQVNIPVLYVKKTFSKTPTITINYDRNKNGFKWNNREDKLFFTSTENGGIVLSVYEVASNKWQKLSPPDEGVASFDVSDKGLAFVTTKVANPFEVYLADTLGKKVQQLSAFNKNWLLGKNVSVPVKGVNTNDKGMSIDYWVMQPIPYDASKKYPVLLNIHGGPTAMWGPGESSMWHEFQYFASKGYFVVYSNPRGSGGYGEQFMRSNINDWGAGPASDVMGALNKAILSNPAIDTSKMVITGGSYAGYLVAWMMGHYHQFKAACAQRGVYDLRTFFGEGNAWRLVPNYFGGYPWQASTANILEKESPINYVHQITTPLIIFHGENDLRTGVIQGEQLYKSLKVLGKQVEYVRHPGATHEITRSGNNRQRIDQMLRTYEFFERFIGKK